MSGDSASPSSTSTPTPTSAPTTSSSSPSSASSPSSTSTTQSTSSSPTSTLSGLQTGHNGALSRPSGVVDLFFPSASQPDIVRSFQKDSYYSRMLAEQYFDVTSRLFGTRLATRFQPELKLFSEITYFMLTTLRGKQTLGEEYCDLVQIHSFSNLPPSLFPRLWLMFWQVIVPYSFEKAYVKASAWSSTSALRSNNGIVSRLLQFSLPQVKDFQVSVQRLHLALFYLYGDFYEFAKRVAAIKYIFNRKLDEARPQYGILGVLIVIQLFVSLIQFSRERAGPLLALVTSPSSPTGTDATTSEGEEEDEEGEDEETSVKSCSLCLEPRKISTATPCGHLFCWTCIHESCLVKRECPVCRHSIEMSRLVRLHHYL